VVTEKIALQLGDLKKGFSCFSREKPFLFSTHHISFQTDKVGLVTAWMAVFLWP